MRGGIRIVFAIFLSLASYGVWAEELRTSGDRPIDIEHIKLDLEVFLAEKRIAGKAIIDLSCLRDLRTVRLDAVGHEVEKISALETSGDGGSGNSKNLTFENTGTELRIDLGEPAARGSKHKITIHYQIREPQAGLHFFGPTAKDPSVPLTVWSQGEPISNRHWIPCLDQPNERQTSELIVTTTEEMEVLSNGHLLERKPLDGGKVRFHWKQDKPHVAYLITLVVGPFAVKVDKWNSLPVTYYVPEDRQQDIDRTFGRTPQMLAFFSKRFGIDYPWSKYAQVVVEQFVAGGMENTSATTLYEAVLHDERALKDSSPDWIIAHELGHQWWGDLVTCKDWAHLWLNEGFATYCELLWAEHHEGLDEMQFQLHKKGIAARRGTTLEKPVLDRHYPHPRNMFDERAYPKGGWVLHMLRCQLGDDIFFRCLQEYGKKFAYDVAETADFRIVLERLSGKSLERFFFQWVENPGHPVLEIKSNYLAEDKLLKVEVKQTQKEGPFHFPLEIEVTFSGTENSRLFDREIRDKEATFYLPADESPLGISIDPKFTLLAEIKEEKSQSMWEWQIASGRPLPDRLRAIDYFGDKKEPRSVELLTQVLKVDGFYGLRAEAANALGKLGRDDARDVLIAGLAEPDSKVRKACVEALGKYSGDGLVAKALEEHLTKGDESYFVTASLLESIALVQQPLKSGPFVAALEMNSHRDVIRQAALKSLGKTEEPESLEVLMDWSQPGHPRDCRVAAMRALPVYVESNVLQPMQEKSVVDLLVAGLRREHPYIRRACAESLRDLQAKAITAVDDLQSVRELDADQRVRDVAKAAIEKIRQAQPATTQLQTLRDKVGSLEDQSRDLLQRIDKIEKR